MPTKKTSPSIHSDPIINDLLKKIPDNFDSNFTNNQLAGLKVALSKRSWNHHPIHFRKSFGLIKWRYYFIFSAGRILRSSNTRNKPLIRTLKIISLTTLITFFATFSILLVYLIKSSLGINLFPDFSLGIWQWFKDSFF